MANFSIKLTDPQDGYDGDSEYPGNRLSSRSKNGFNQKTQRSGMDDENDNLLSDDDAYSPSTVP